MIFIRLSLNFICSAWIWLNVLGLKFFRLCKKLKNNWFESFFHKVAHHPRLNNTNIVVSYHTSIAEDQLTSSTVRIRVHIVENTSILVLHYTPMASPGEGGQGERPPKPEKIAKNWNSSRYIQHTFKNCRKFFKLFQKFHSNFEFS